MGLTDCKNTNFFSLFLPVSLKISLIYKKIPRAMMRTIVSGSEPLFMPFYAYFLSIAPASLQTANDEKQRVISHETISGKSIIAINK